MTRRKYIFFLAMPVILVLLVSWSEVRRYRVPGNSLPERRDHPRHMNRYQLTTQYYQNGKWKSRSVAVCRVRIYRDSAGRSFGEVRWLSEKVFTEKDTTDESELARSVTPYSIALDPGARLDLPPISEPAMTGPVTDFNTFFVAIHDKSGRGHLKKTGDTYVSSSPVKGNFANGKTILKGEDCIHISSTLLDVRHGAFFIETRFEPPATPCLDYYLPEFGTPVAGDTLNNIQMVMAAGPGKFNVQYGKEQFVIRSRVKRKNGLLLLAKMTNDLVLRLKINCNDSLDHCQAEVPWHIYREVELKCTPD